MIGKKRIRTYAMRFIAGVLVLLAIMSMPIIASAVGDPNMGGGGGSGGGTGGGTGSNKWPTEGGQTLDGVRVSVYKGSTKVGNTIDFSNFTKVDGTAMKNISHFGQKSKKEIMKDKKVTYRNGNYAVVNTTGDVKLPKIIKGNINTIRNYFIRENVVRFIASKTGVNYNTMVNDSSYQLMIEPIIYVIYNGYPYAMTATEIGYFNDGLGNYKKGHLRNNGTLQRILFDNVPNAIYLEKDAFGIKRWTGATSGYQSESNVKNRLGVGAVSFKDSGLASKIETQPVGLVSNPNWNEGDNARLSVIFMNNGSSAGTFPITIWVGDGINKGKAEAYKVETSIRIGAGQTYIYTIPKAVTMQPWITTVTARINWGNRSKEINPNNNEQTFALNVKKKDTIETSVTSLRILDSDGKVVSRMIAGQKYSIEAKFRNDSTTQTKFPVSITFNVPAGSGSQTVTMHSSTETIAKGKTITVKKTGFSPVTTLSAQSFVASINYSNRSSETNPNNNRRTATASIEKIETSTIIPNVFVYRDGSWKALAGMPAAERFVYVGDKIKVQAVFVNNSTSHKNFDTEVWVGDGMGVGGAEKLIWQNGDNISPARPSTNRPAKTKLYAFSRTPYGENITTGEYVVQSTDKEITTRINYYTSASYNPFIGKDFGAGRQKEMDETNNQATYKLNVKPSDVETSTEVSALLVERPVPGSASGAKGWYNYQDLEAKGFEPLTEGDKVKVVANYKNESTVRTNFFANLYIGDGLGHAPQTEYKLWQNGEHLSGAGGPSSWTLPVQATPHISSREYTVKYTDKEITSRINYSAKDEEIDPNNNEDIYHFKVKSLTETGVSIPEVEVYRDGEWQVLDKNDPVVYEGEEIRPYVVFNNESHYNTDFQSEIWIGDGWGTAPLIEQLVWENGKNYNPPHPSNDRPTKPDLFHIPVRNSKEARPTYKVVATDKEITAVINWDKSAYKYEINPDNNKAIYEIDVVPRTALAETSVEEVMLINITDVGDEEFVSNWREYYDDVKEYGKTSDYYVGEGGTRMKAGQRVAFFYQLANNSSRNYPSDSFSRDFLLNGENWNREDMERMVTIPRGSSISGVEMFTVTNDMINAANPTLGNSLEFEVRVNWEGRETEMDPNNNSLAASSGVVPDNLSVDPLEPNAYYTEDTEVMTTFIINNDFSVNINPDDGLSALINPYYLDEDGDRVDIDSIQIDGIVVPSKGTNIIYTKWNVPEYDVLADGKVYIECVLNPDGTVTEEDYEDNITVVSNDVVTRERAETPDPVFRLKLPRNFNRKYTNPNSSSNRRVALRGVTDEEKVDDVKDTYTWEEWIWDGSKIVKENYEVGVDIKTDHETGAHLYPGIRARAAITRDKYTKLDTFETTSGSAVSLVYVPQYIRSENSRDEQITKVQNVYTVFPEFGNTYYPEDRRLTAWYGIEYAEAERYLFRDDEDQAYRTLEKVSYEDYLNEKAYQQYFPGDNRYLKRKFEMASEGDDIWMFAPLSYGMNPEEVGLPEDFVMRQHYTPLWFPNNYEYVVGVVPVDVWTPLGMATSPQTSSPVSIWKTIYDEFSIPTWNAGNKPSDERMKDLLYGHRRYYKYWKSDVDDSYGDGWNEKHKLWELLRNN